MHCYNALMQEMKLPLLYRCTNAISIVGFSFLNLIFILVENNFVTSLTLYLLSMDVYKPIKAKGRHLKPKDAI